MGLESILDQLEGTIKKNMYLQDQVLLYALYHPTMMNKHPLFYSVKCKISLKKTFDGTFEGFNLYSWFSWSTVNSISSRILEDKGFYIQTHFKPKIRFNKQEEKSTHDEKESYVNVRAKVLVTRVFLLDPGKNI